MVVYADAVWFLNVCIDYLLLMLTAVILKRNVKKWRLLIGAFIGSSIVVFAFTPFAPIMTHPAIKLLYSVCIVYAAFGFTRFRVFFQTMMMFYFVTFMVGGGLVGFHFFMQTNAIVDGIVSTKSISFGDPVSWMFVLFGFPIIYFFSKQRIQNIEITEIRYDQIVRLEIVIGETKRTFSGLIDSGNQLYDPLTKIPVMIIDAAHARELFPDWLLEQAKNISLFAGWKEDGEDWISRLRIIPYRGVGQQQQMMLAVKPDIVRVYKQEEIVSVSRVLIGLSYTTLSSDREYECILHPKMFVGAKILPA